MEALKLDIAQREQLFAELARMPEFLEARFSSLTAELARKPANDGGFSPIEQVWHLADLEREGFGVRITRLQREQEPHLPDFDGDAIAKQRDYRSLSMNKGLLAFASARWQNLSALRDLASGAWMRRGTQEGVGPVTLCDLPGFMLQHDRAHQSEIDAWWQQNAH